MMDTTLIFVAAVFALAGFVKGVIGLGLPTIAMGLLAIVMPPIEAAAILILPSLFTNLWQMAVGPSLWKAAARLWPMMLAVCLGTWAGLGLMTGAHARDGIVLLGVALMLYAGTGLSAVRIPSARAGTVAGSRDRGDHRGDRGGDGRVRDTGSALPPSHRT